MHDLELAFEKLMGERKLDASLDRLAERIPHRQRVDLALQTGGGASVVQFHGLSAVAIGGLPRDRLLPVLGEWMPPDEYVGCWRRRFAFDFRPHTHHWQVMREVRAAPTQSGVLNLAGTRLCMFMTTWGDGTFPVEFDLDAAGQMLRVRIEVGCDEIVDRQREFEKEWFDQAAERT